MRTPTKQSGTDVRATATAAGHHHTGSSAMDAHAETGDAGTTPGADQRGVVTSMVDALEDILRWERASERALRIAAAQSPTELDPSN